VNAVNNGGDNRALLQRMLRKRPPPGERCDFCAATLAPEHRHLIELAARRIACSCRPCYIVFEPEGAGAGRYRPIPERYLELGDFSVDDSTWDQLAIPIGLAFFFYNSLEAKMVAFYPSPVGATESLLALDTWGEIAAANPVLSSLNPDVEAILVQRSPERRRCFIVPIDAAYELVGTIRSTWKGFDGGEGAHRRIEEFFAKIEERARGAVAASAP
jgi:Family of unknown function (DUF5947)